MKRWNMMCFFTFVIFLQFFIFIYAGRIQDKLFNVAPIQISRFDGECRGKNVPLRIYYSGIKCDTKSILIANCTITVKEDLMDNLKLDFTVRRCQSKENLDTCEEFYKVRNLDYCGMINPDGLFGQNPLAAQYKPKMKCPIKENVYYGCNLTFSTIPFIISNPHDSYWRIETQTFSPNKNRLINCLHIEASISSKSKV